MEVSSFVKGLLIVLTIIATSSACCPRKTDSSGYPIPELKFPGLTEDAAKENTKSVVSLIITIGTNFANFIPGGKVIAPIAKGLVAMDTILSGKDKEFVKLVNQGLLNQTMFDIRTKMATTSKQMKLVELHMEKKENYSDMLSIALFNCDEILEKYKDETGPLFRNGNVLVSAPSLLSFSALYSGISGISYKRWPLRRAHILGEMDALVNTVEKYKKEVLQRRMAYLTVKSHLKKACDVKCEDEYDDLISCDSCSRVKCDSRTVFTANYDIKVYRNYEKELRRKYELYFKEPLEKLKALVHQMQNS